MAPTIKNVVIIGATGNLGPSLVDAILADGKFTLTATSRDPSKAKLPSAVKVVQLGESPSEEDLLAAFKGQDAVIDLIHSRADITPNKQRIDAAIKSGVKLYLPGEFGSNRQDPHVLKVLGFLQGPKLAVQQYLQSKEKEGLIWTGVVNGAFFDWCLTHGVLGFDLKEHKATIYDDGNAKTPLTLLPTVGQAVAAILSDPSKTANRLVHIESYLVSQNEILAALEKTTSEKWTIEHDKALEAEQRGADEFLGGNFGGIVTALAGSIFSGKDFVDYGKIYGLDNDKLGLPPVSHDVTPEVAKIVAAA